ncbi:MAG TPA: FUSC family protein [Acetobacteraceae bacterium]|nr:FUSC family protein [Acetobacteraceae bacterium]
MNRALPALGSIPGKLLRECVSLTWRGPPARGAAEAVLSVWLALLIGRAVHVEEADWAAFTAFMVLRTVPRDALARAALRLCGTVLGAALAVGVAVLTAGIAWRVSVALLIPVGLSLFLGLTARFSYAWVLTGVTYILVLTDTLVQARPAAAIAYARAEEVCAGTLAAVVVALGFALVFRGAAMPPSGGSGVHPPGGIPHDPHAALWRAAEGAVAVALLPLLHASIGLPALVQSAITALILLSVPLDRSASWVASLPIAQRMAERTTGALLGGGLAVLAILAGRHNEVLWWGLIAVVVFVGWQVANGREGVGYTGLQFVVGFLLTFIQGVGPIGHADVALGRLVGIMVGIVVLGAVLLAGESIRLSRAAQEGAQGRVR